MGEALGAYGGVTLVTIGKCNTFGSFEGCEKFGIHNFERIVDLNIKPTIVTDVDRIKSKTMAKDVKYEGQQPLHLHVILDQI